MVDFSEWVRRQAHGLANVEDFVDGTGLLDYKLVHKLTSRDPLSLLWWGLAWGWKPISDKSGEAIRLVSHDGQTIVLPDKNLKFSVFRQQVNKIIRHRVEGPGHFNDRPPALELVDQLQQEMSLDPDHLHCFQDAVAKMRPVDPPTMDVSPAEAAITDTLIPLELQPRPAGRKRRVKREEPWAAHGDIGRDGMSNTYPSDAVWEKEWTTGETTYHCRWPDCDYERNNPRSVASHYTSHVRGQGRNTQPETDGIDPDHTPARKARIRRLRSELDAAMAAALREGITPDNEWIAAWIIDHRIERLVDDRGDDVVEELTAEQVIDKIVALADRGRSKILREQIDALQDQVDSYETVSAERLTAVEAEVANAHAQLAQAVAERDAATDRWAALRSIVNDDS